LILRMGRSRGGGVGLVEIFRLTTLEDDIFDPGWYTGISSYPRD
jgi:hypothetical protein